MVAKETRKTRKRKHGEESSTSEDEDEAESQGDEGVQAALLDALTPVLFAPGDTIMQGCWEEDAPPAQLW